MTPKEKAKELFEKMRVHSPVWEIEGDAKQCALIAVDELIEATIKSKRIKIKSKNTISGVEETVVDVKDKYWQEVKQEILAL